MITGKDLINAGFEPGEWFGDAIKAANENQGNWRDVVASMVPPAPKALDPYGKPIDINITIDNDVERANYESSLSSMREVLRTPGTVEGALMPDTCPAGPLGTIPVGGVVSSKYIHPGMHSADICCSMYASYYSDAHPKALLDSFHALTHFGTGGREQIIEFPSDLERRIRNNFYTRDFLDLAKYHFMTQGDGNHFAFVGFLESTGETALVTHHGSRGFGAKVYKRAMEVAEKARKKNCPDCLKQNAWIEDESGDYWEAIEIIRDWTYRNHSHLHALHSFNPFGTTFNEHNFVFKKEDGLFYHAKGATPAFGQWTEQDTLIPMNMRDGILVARGLDKGMGFSPHGAGRNMSRTKHKAGICESIDETMRHETYGLDVRFFSGKPDISELPSAYKPAIKVEAEIKKYGLANIVDRIIPYGCIMAGEQEKNWRYGNEP